MSAAKRFFENYNSLYLLLLNSIFIAFVSIVLGVLSIHSAGLLSSWDWPKKLFFAVLTGGTYFVYSFVIIGAFILLLRGLRFYSIIPLITAFFDFIVLAYLAADTFVYPMYRTHLNLAMLQMTFLGGGRIVNFSFPMIAEIIGYLFSITFVIAVFFAIAKRVSDFKIVGILSLGCLLGFIWANVLLRLGIRPF